MQFLLPLIGNFLNLKRGSAATQGGEGIGIEGYGDLLLEFPWFKHQHTTNSLMVKPNLGSTVLRRAVISHHLPKVCALAINRVAQLSAVGS
jgi:hypothetical protein